MASSAEQEKFYEATSQDSLASIAIRFNSTVSELKAFNKLSTQLIFPGQKLLIPPHNSNSAVNNNSALKNFQPSNPINVPSSKSTKYSLENLSSFEEISVCECENLSSVITSQPLPFSLPKSSPFDEVTETFLRINAKYLTWSQGCVKGKLVLTPQSIMFEPLLSDPLVEEFGVATFEVILLMDSVIECTITSDFSKFIMQKINTSPKVQPKKPISSKEINPKVKPPLSPPGVFCTSPDIMLETIRPSDSCNPDSDKSHILSGCNSNDSSANISFNPESGAIHYKPSHNVNTVSPVSSHNQAKHNKDILSNATSRVDDEKKTSAQSNSIVRTNSPASFVNNLVSKTKKVIRSNSGNIIIPTDTNSQTISKKDTIIAMSSRIRSISNPLPSQDEDEDISQPMFLRLHIEKEYLNTFESNAQALLHKFVPILSPENSNSKNSNREEYWFAVPNSRVDTLYAFFLSWHNLTTVYPQSSTTSSSKAISSNAEPLNDGSFSLKFKENHFFELGSSPFVVLDDIDVIREKDFRKEIDSCPLPSLIGACNILTDALLKELTYVLPSRTVGHSLFLVYSTFLHGISLLTMYRKMESCDSSVVFIIRDDNYHIFGGIVSCPLKISENHYGTGESFLFSFDQTANKLNPYYWTGVNSFFVKGDKDVIIFGGGNGKHAICLDGDFYHGSCYDSQTFGNPRLSVTEDFLCTGFEAWGFAN